MTLRVAIYQLDPWHGPYIDTSPFFTSALVLSATADGIVPGMLLRTFATIHHMATDDAPSSNAGLTDTSAAQHCARADHDGVATCANGSHGNATAVPGDRGLQGCPDESPCPELALCSRIQ
jgi:hypothetical protein